MIINIKYLSSVINLTSVFAIQIILTSAKRNFSFRSVFSKFKKRVILAHASKVFKGKHRTRCDNSSSKTFQLYFLIIIKVFAII